MNSTELKLLIADFRNAATNFEADLVQSELKKLFSAQAQVRMCHPFGELSGGQQLFDNCYKPLLDAIPDLERRDHILLAGTSPEGAHWIGCMGNYLGTFLHPFMEIPPTGHLVFMRYHEFFRVEGDQIVEMQAIWDIPELMMRANAWPLAPQLGAFINTPAPMSGDGLSVSGDGQHTMQHVIDMLEKLCQHPADPDPAVMELEKFWHPRSNWYGPAGIGTNRGKAGFRNWHQLPFLRATPDRKLDAMGDLMSHWVAEGDYVCETGWPNMRLTLSEDGWMGIAPAGKEVLLRSLDFWRMEDGLIRENWVLVDLLDLYHQIGVDVFARLREFNKARNIGSINLPDGMQPVG